VTILIETIGSDGIRRVPVRLKDGNFRVGQPHLTSAQRKLRANQLAVATEWELVDHLRRGFHLRMAAPGESDGRLIEPQKIVVRFIRPF
jgi:hypothetical protein